MEAAHTVDAKTMVQSELTQICLSEFRHCCGMKLFQSVAEAVVALMPRFRFPVSLSDIDLSITFSALDTACNQPKRYGRHHSALA